MRHVTAATLGTFPTATHSYMTQSRSQHDSYHFAKPITVLSLMKMLVNMSVVVALLRAMHTDLLSVNN